jgi:ribosomal protein S18 acetylase RimI-like enzyme
MVTGSHNAGVEIRKASPADAPTVAKLGAVVQAFHHEHRPDWFKPAEAEGAVELYEQFLLDPSVVIYVAEDETRHPLGYALVRVLDRPESPLTWGAKVIEIDQIGVTSDQRRHGVGTALLQAVRKLAEESGTDRVHLTVWGFNEAAQAFFASQGFKQAMLRMTDP